MANIRQIDFQTLDIIFGMESGYVLQFSDRTFANFFATELNIDIYEPMYRNEGTSKAKRLRCFLKTVEDSVAVKTLEALWEYRETQRENSQQSENIPNTQGRLLTIISRLKSEPHPSQFIKPVPAFNVAELASLKEKLTALSSLPPQNRGYEFEKFLKSLFNLFGLKAHEPFRLRGEQIDGSFELNSETYLLEAKWHQLKVGAEPLHAFHGKLEQKASWARGLFVSYSGFTAEGLHAFGQAKKLICMDGLDIFESMNRQLPLNVVLEKKVRKAAESGRPFVALSDLFP
jgi:restriction endonuclease Mrr